MLTIREFCAYQLYVKDCFVKSKIRGRWQELSKNMQRKYLQQTDEQVKIFLQEEKISFKNRNADL